MLITVNGTFENLDLERFDTVVDRFESTKSVEVIDVDLDPTAGQFTILVKADTSEKPVGHVVDELKWVLNRLCVTATVKVVEPALV